MDVPEEKGFSWNFESALVIDFVAETERASSLLYAEAPRASCSETSLLRTMVCKLDIFLKFHAVQACALPYQSKLGCHIQAQKEAF